MVLKNGLLDSSLLQLTSGGRKLSTPAALSYERLDTVFERRFGKTLLFGDGWTGYRSLEQQVVLYDQLGYPKAAIPGTSNHGYGLAADFASGVNIYGSVEWRWMNTEGRTHGWVPLNEGNLKFEPWHWVYTQSRDQHYGEAPLNQPPAVVEPPVEIAKDDDDMAFTATGPDGQIWHLAGVFRRPISQDQANALSVLADPATVPYLGSISAVALAGYADVGGVLRTVTEPEPEDA